MSAFPIGPGFVIPDGYDLQTAKESVGPGWRPLIEGLFRYIEQNSDTPQCKDLRIIQVKEKFGGLRIYVIGGDIYLTGILHGLELASYTICEACGKPGRLRGREGGRGWMLTLCDECQETPRPFKK